MRIVTVILMLLIILGLGFAAMVTNVITDHNQLVDLNIPVASGFSIDKTLNLNSKVLSTPQVSQNFLFIQTQSKIYAIELSTQTIIWERKIQGRSANHAMLATEEVIFVPSNHSNILALDFRTGVTLWETSGNDYGDFLSDIAFYGERVFIAFHNRDLESRLMSTGEILWSFPLPSRSEINLLPINDEILLLSSYGHLSAINSQTGEVIWNREGNQEEFTYIRDKRLIVALERFETELTISGIDPDSGALLWSTPISSIRVNCIANDGVSVYVSGDGLLSFNTDSKRVVWVSTLVDNLVCPILYDGDIFVNKNGRDMYIFNQENGKLLSHLELSWFLFSNNDIDPVIKDNYLIVTTKRNSISILKIGSLK